MIYRRHFVCLVVHVVFLDIHLVRVRSSLLSV